MKDKMAGKTALVVGIVGSRVNLVSILEKYDLPIVEINDIEFKKIDIPIIEDLDFDIIQHDQREEQLKKNQEKLRRKHFR